MGTIIAPSDTVVFVGLGQMGLPMARRCIAAGFAVRGADPSQAARDALAAAGGEAFATGREAARGAQLLITMLPDSKVVREAVIGEQGVADVLASGALVIDMSSSVPVDTQALGRVLAGRGIGLIDAPVSGGVKRAIDGTLSIMAGGEADHVARARPVLEAMARAVFATGPLGSGHAMKALNNYVSAAGLIAACEALLVGRRFGLEPDTIIDVLNASTGKNNSTDVKMKQFVISETFASGFSLALMAKDLRIAADLTQQMGLAPSQAEAVAVLWEQARGTLGPAADHTDIYRFIAAAATEPGDGGPSA
ncbi:MAG: NAD(P)-dependent oxidoreductase [Afipia sp.]|jgi:3-hydroxyisobutyrate dehydrogenase|nr:NAD(P)-dependent oxidoreductase [Afipia sp.]